MSRSRNRNRNRSNGGNGAPAPQGQPANHIDLVRPFRFKNGDKVYELPPAAVAQERMNAGHFLDAVLDGEAGQLKYFALMLQHAEPSAEAMAALRSMDMDRFGTVMEQWLKRTGGHPGKSAASSG
jgi:hypothetical protein